MATLTKGQVSPITHDSKPQTHDEFEAVEELTLLVEDFGEPPQSDFANELIEVGRHIELQVDAKIRMTTPDSEAFDARVFVMNDMLLIGRYRVYKAKEKKHGNSKRKGSKSTNHGSSKHNHGHGKHTEADHSLTDISHVASQTTLTDENGDGHGLEEEHIDSEEKAVIGMAVEDFKTNEDALQHLEEASTMNTLKRQLAKKRPLYKIKVFIVLYGNVTVTDVHDAAGNNGIRLELKEKDYVEREDGYIETKIVSKHTVLYFDNKETMESVAKTIHAVQHKLLEIEIQREEEAIIEAEKEYREHKKSLRSGSSGSVSGGGSDDGHSDDGEEHEGEGEDGENQSVGTGTSKKALKPLPFKKKMLTAQKIKHARGTLDKDEKAAALKTLHKQADSLKMQRDMIPTKDTGNVFEVTFPGPMGMKLTSGKVPDKYGNIIVIVGELADGGTAKKSGVTLGDKVVEIGGIKKDKLWTQEDCVKEIERLKKTPGPDGKPIPLVIKFSRLSREDELKEDEMEARKERAKERNKGRTMVDQAIDVGRTFGMRDPNGKRTKRIMNKKDREQRRDEQERCDDIFDRLLAKASNEDEKQCAYVMREIHSTEKSYLSDLYGLVDLYMEKMMKTLHVVSCKENGIVNGIEKCEHGLPSAECEQMSSAEKPLLSLKDKKLIFANLESIVKLNEELLTQVQKGLLILYDRMDQFDGKDIGVIEVADVIIEPFIKMTPFFGMYAQYASRYSKAMDRWKELKLSSEDFANKVKEIEGYRKVKTFNTLLILPVTRLTKYPLLFQQLKKQMTKYLAKHAFKDAVDHLESSGSSTAGVQELLKNTDEEKLATIKELIPNMDKVADMLTAVAGTVNLKVDEQFKMEKLDEIYEELGGIAQVKDFLQPSRRFVKRFENVMFEEQKGAKYIPKKDRVIILLNDMIIIGAYSNQAKKAQEKVGKSNGAKRSSVMGGDSTLHSDRSQTGKPGGSSFFGNFMNLGGRKAPTPDIIVDYILELGQVKIKPLPRKGADGQSGVMFIMHLTEADIQRKGKKKTMTPEDEPLITKIDIFFETPEERNAFDESLEKEKRTLEDNAASIRDAQAQYGYVTLNMREQRAEKMRQRAGIGMSSRNAATSTVQRTETLKKKLEAMRAEKKKKSQG